MKEKEDSRVLVPIIHSTFGKVEPEESACTAGRYQKIHHFIHYLPKLLNGSGPGPKFPDQYKSLPYLFYHIHSLSSGDDIASYFRKNLSY